MEQKTQRRIIENHFCVKKITERVNIYRQKYKRNMYGTCHLNENVLLLLFSDVWC